ncbi:MAG: hypothetical protein ABJM11_10335 [Marinobacter sp.]|uniref:hypothetical protein n=1 Tax=Marinobacter sp. TaxID=50741 RepID=UPI003298869D
MTNRGRFSRNGHCWQPTELVSTLLSVNAREVVRHWISSRPFLDANNEPTLLPMASSDETGFNALVGLVNSDLAPTVIFNELLRKGIVEQHENGCLLLRRSAYVPEVPRQGDTAPCTEEQAEAGRALRRRSNDFR